MKLLNLNFVAWYSCAWLVAFLPSALGDDTTQRAAQFEQEIRPVLISKCLKCHGTEKQEGGLRLDSYAGILQGGDSGEALVIGKPDESLLIEALKYESFEMPPTGQLAETTIEQFERWIANGAIWPEHTLQLRPQSEAIAEEDRQWWAFQPVMKYPAPSMENDAWSRNEIDRFVLRRLAEHDMQPAPAAGKATLARRLYLDLVGMPPTPEEIAAFVDDASADAWEDLIDRLLSDKRYGEHWARYWLDLVRYSESDGWNLDAYRPEIWRYRDYVVSAFNDDKPYPDFVREQLAGDEIPGDNPEPRIAAGFMRLGIYEYNQRDARGHWNDIVNEMTDVAGDVFFGLSMACCRCHDHKFDPLPQKDYFKLRAFFEPVIWRDDLVGATQQEQRVYQQQLSKWEAATSSLRSQLDELLKPYHDLKWASTADKFPLDIQACFNTPVEKRTSWDHQMAYLVSRQFLEEGGGPLKGMKKQDQEKLDAIEAELAAFDELKPVPLPAITTVSDFAGAISPTTIPSDPDQESIEPGFLAVMSHSDWSNFVISNSGILGVSDRSASPIFVSTDASSMRNTTGRRTALAKWIGNPNNPLTTRVIVNRIWQQHFGEGIVATSSDFGRNGTLPSHPELLDWLTATFVENGWSFKQLHKLILMSATWQQSAHHPLAEEYQIKDPTESRMWRTRIRRLQAEQIRDALLVASGELETQVGGPSIDEQTPRRALYVKSFRNKSETFLHGFDMANGLKSVPVRDATTTPTQALMLINGDYALDRAKKMADQLSATGDRAPRDILQRACMLTWGRQPTDSELTSAMRFVGLSPGEERREMEHARLVDFCHVLFNSNEFLYVE